MLTLGYVGDRIGRARAMQLTLGLIAGGAVASAGLSIGSETCRLYLLVGWRFLLGIGMPRGQGMAAHRSVQGRSVSEAGAYLRPMVGMGGIFPLSAVASAEGGAVAAQDTGRCYSLIAP